MKKTILLLATALALAPIGSTADELKTDILKPGLLLDHTNIHEYGEYLSPAMQWCVKRGVKIRVAENKPAPMPPPLREATEKYSAQVKLSEDGNYLIDHIAGIPFPNIDTNDEWAGTKLVFNFETAVALDDLDLRNFDCDTGAVGRDGSSVRVEKHFLIDHIRRLYFVGRLEVEPYPDMPNKDKVRYKEALYPLIEPFDLKGVGFTLNRYLDPPRHDDTWLYLPILRRVRRLSSAQRSDALFGQDTDMDSYAGYAGKPGWFSWRLVGEKTVLGSFHAEKLPVVWGEPSGDFVHADLWEPRRVWVIEGTPKLPQYAYSKRVLFLDKESLLITYTDMYDQAGELWKMWLNEYKLSRSPIDGAQYEAPYVRRFNPSISMVDIQLEHATFCSLPSSRFPGEQGWYVNLGDQEGTTEEYFSLSNIISAGR